MKIKRFIGSLLAIALCFSSILALCQKPEAIYYLKKSGYVMPNIKDADYLLLILPPDTSADKDLFVVKEYYANGDLRFISGTKTLTLQDLYAQTKGFSKPVLQGAYISYFHNGHKMQIAHYADGYLVGDDMLYYPNGKLYCTRTYTKESGFHFNECRDSTGKVLFENGNGTGITFSDESFKNYLSGEVVNGLPQGKWTGKQDDTTYLSGIYKNGELKTEAKIDKNGQKTYMLLDTVAEFPGGLNAFSKYLAYNVRYPAVARENNTQGRVIVGFIVNEDGSLSDFKIIKSVSKEIDDEAISVLKMSPKWKPGIVDGQPVRILYAVPINFTLSGN